MDNSLSFRPGLAVLAGLLAERSGTRPEHAAAGALRRALASGRRDGDRMADLLDAAAEFRAAHAAFAAVLARAGS